MAFSKEVLPEEKARLKDLVSFERQARTQGYKWVAGVDEAGRGPLAGPVVAAACIIPRGIFFSGINDSKKLTADQRETLFHALVSHPKIIYAIGIISAEIIDRVNIYQATIQAMFQAVSGLTQEPDYLLVDGMALPHSIPSQKIIGGDAKSQSIAAASILAKVTRDRMAQEWEIKWPQYGFGKHKGYGTPQHLAALAEHGPCPLHRHSFAPIAKKKSVQLELGI